MIVTTTCNHCGKKKNCFNAEEDPYNIGKYYCRECLDYLGYIAWASYLEQESCNGCRGCEDCIDIDEENKNEDK